MKKGYLKYKESFVFNIGKIPEQWKTSSLNHVVDFIMGQAPHSDSYNTEGNGEVFIKTGDFTELRPIVKWYTTKPLVWASECDVFMCVVGATAGKVNLGVNGTISRSIAALRPRKSINQKYLFYFLSCNYQILNDSSQGSAQGIINKSILSSINFPVPTEYEQTQIAAFLDYQTSLIDALIAKKEALIDKLKLQRQAIINEAVTKGLDPNAKFKDSGIEWLGEIPEEWEVVKLGKVGVFSKGKGITKEIISEEGNSCIRCGEIYTTYDISFNDAVSHIPDDKIGDSISFEKDVLLMAGDGETNEDIGKTILYNGEKPLYVGGGINVFIPKRNIVDPEFLTYALNSRYSIYQKSRDGRGGIIVHIYSKQIKDHYLVLPILQDQKEIVRLIKVKLSSIFSCTDKVLDQIQKLKLYRQSLISEAVTGKIDVREWKPKTVQV